MSPEKSVESLAVAADQIAASVEENLAFLATLTPVEKCELRRIYSELELLTHRKGYLKRRLKQLHKEGRERLADRNL